MKNTQLRSYHSALTRALTLTQNLMGQQMNPMGVPNFNTVNTTNFAFNPMSNAPPVNNSANPAFTAQFHTTSDHISQMFASQHASTRRLGAVVSDMAGTRDLRLVGGAVAAALTGFALLVLSVYRKFRSDVVPV